MAIIKRKTNKKLARGPKRKLPTIIEIEEPPTDEVIPASTQLTISDGIVVVSGDWHCYYAEWKLKPPTAYRALLKFLKGEIGNLNHPIKANIVNGDFLNAAQIHRHAPITWENHGGSFKQEMELTQDMMGNVEEVCAKHRIQRRATIGNHDIRVMAHLAAKVPEWAGMPNTTLMEYFPNWNLSWSVNVNDNILIKHRWGGGQYAPAINATKSGKSCITGHLHRAAVYPVRDANGLRWGADHGCVASIHSAAFSNYTESTAAYTWTSGFAVLTIGKDKRLLAPELLTVVDEVNGLINFRGEIVKV
jgi:hypothetical protein